VDLDGVLATYSKWEGPLKIGEPIVGAADFTQRLAEHSRVIIFTSRLHDAHGDPEVDLDVIEDAVRSWLERHGFAFSEIYRGQGKPLARADIDDRAVRCRPQVTGAHAAFTEAEAQVKELMR
jgi:hypothetical protein